MQKPPNSPCTTYSVIYCDPPWFYNNRKAGGASKHYDLMKTPELLAMRPMIDKLAQSNCALFMWATAPLLPDAITLINGWGFRYTTIAFVWEKISKAGTPIYNPGFYTASNVELVLLGVRGSMKPTTPMISQIVREPKREHSRKPDVVRWRIDDMYQSKDEKEHKKIELFARQLVNGWDSWGMEVDKYNAQAY